ncbi:MAG: glycerol acyltransferase, partial [Bdellovibrionales bacterium]
MSAHLYFRNKKFTPLFWTQFFGALNDNFLKNSLVIIITFKAVTFGGLPSSSLVALCGGIFIIPFVFFSPLAGQIADKCEKSRLIRLIKWFEVLIMIIAGLGFYFHHYSLL